MQGKQRQLIGCGILQLEVEHILCQLGKTENLHVQWLPAALHTNLDNLKEAISKVLVQGDSREEKVLLYGNQCHPEIEDLCKFANAKGFKQPDCIGLLIGDKIHQLNKEASTFYLTPGWLQNWQEIFVAGLGWDSIDARQNFGIYDRILLLDTGVLTIEEEKILEFFEYTQVPIEISPISLDYLKDLIIETLE